MRNIAVVTRSQYKYYAFVQGRASNNISYMWAHPAAAEDLRGRPLYAAYILDGASDYMINSILLPALHPNGILVDMETR